MKKHFGFAPFLLSIAILAFCICVPALADPCLVVYPVGRCIYHYDAMEYYTVTYGHPLYNPAYDRGGKVLLERDSNKIDLSVYQASCLAGFQVSSGGNEGYFTIGYTFDLIIDGFSNVPRTFYNVRIVFEPDPSYCTPEISVEGNQVSGPPFEYPIGDLVVSTLVPGAKHYSNTITKFVEWSGCYGITVWAYADEDNNGVHDGGECFSAFSHDTTVPVERSTWGAVKARYE